MIVSNQDQVFGKWRKEMTYDKATDPDAGLRLDFTSRKRDGFISSTDDSMRHEMQRMADKINQLEKRIIELEKK